MRQYADGFAPDGARVIENSPKLRSRCGSLLRRQVRFASQINRIQNEIQVLHIAPKVHGSGRHEGLYGFFTIAAPQERGRVNGRQITGLHDRIFRKTPSQIIGHSQALSGIACPRQRNCRQGFHIPAVRKRERRLCLLLRQICIAYQRLS